MTLSSYASRGRRARLKKSCMTCNTPLKELEYIDDLSGEKVKRLRCPKCNITYQPTGKGK